MKGSMSFGDASFGNPRTVSLAPAGVLEAAISIPCNVGNKGRTCMLPAGRQWRKDGSQGRKLRKNHFLIKKKKGGND